MTPERLFGLIVGGCIVVIVVVGTIYLLGHMGVHL